MERHAAPSEGRPWSAPLSSLVIKGQILCIARQRNAWQFEFRTQQSAETTRVPEAVNVSIVTFLQCLTGVAQLF
jgi:hypothetical protein